MKQNQLFVLCRLIILLLTAGMLYADDATDSDFRKIELGLWSSGGYVANDHGRDTRVWAAGFHIGKILMGSRSSKSLEYGGEFNPAFVVFQSRNVYGVEAIPLLLKWTFAPSSRIHPYTEMGGGLLFSRSQVPENTSAFNFTPQVRFGLEFPMGEDHDFQLAFKYVHISNADLAKRNRGYNTLQMQFAYGWFR